MSRWVNEVEAELKLVDAGRLQALGFADLTLTRGVGNRPTLSVSVECLLTGLNVAVNVSTGGYVIHVYYNRKARETGWPRAIRRRLRFGPEESPKVAAERILAEVTASARSAEGHVWE